MLRNPAALAPAKFALPKNDQAIYIVRHADCFSREHWETTCREEQYSPSRAADVPLSDEGKQMARDTGNFFARSDMIIELFM